MATTENLSTLKIHKLSQKQYDNALKEGKIENNELYLTPDEDWIIITEEGTTVEITAENKTEYYLPNATQVTIVAPSDVEQYECWISIAGDPTVSFPESMQRIGFDCRDAYSSIQHTEISIKNGKYIIGYAGVAEF
jgi:hypothetical protein